MDGLLQAILEEPDSDDLRLIYADWLDEHGQEGRAEFIRVQVELAELLSHGCGGYFCDDFLGHFGCRLLRLQELERKILTVSNALRWTPNRFFGRVNRVVFRRGLIDEITVCYDDWLKYWSDLLQEQPIQKVRLAGKHPLCTGSGAMWRWYDSPATWQQRFELPRELVLLLEGASSSASLTKWYPSEEAALDALSVACFVLVKQHQVAIPEVCHA